MRPQKRTGTQSNSYSNDQSSSKESVHLGTSQENDWVAGKVKCKQE
jgi:hypothetical protein